MSKVIPSFFIVILLFLVSGVIAGDTHTATRAFHVVPPNYAGTQGTGTFLGPLTGSPRTYQMLIRDTMLTSLVGTEITGMTFRLLVSASSNWPPADVTFTNYDIYLSESVAPENRSFTFAQNVVGVQKRVRFGSLTITAGSFPFGGSPTTFGTDITFDSAYVYNGGHLLIEIRHTGFSGTSASTDAILTSTSGYAFLFSACWAGSYTATSTTTQGNFVVTRLNASPLTSTGNNSEIVKSFSLSQNYPNPFNPVTNITFNLQKSANVSLKIFNVSGEEIETLVNNESMQSGTRSILFNGEKLSSGVYFYSLFVDGAKVDTKKMMLIK
ncbi:MAG TPA: T9SS type A sorting domain-containing protein [Ignavibacteria bacterium]|nr:T9SS type A sorting domain-containing protein [Ignavibacteria bacterium]HRF66559.1 T9SS type A sorting domain-containing protein [Ignavibacteria bacterium]HRJ03712.1 T9SS type A sorting domain-containing protein [Ignavibacteria bacterium]